MAKITIDNQAVEVPDGLNLIQAAKHAGVKIPHYCYHPKLSIAGNCRMCLIELEKIPKLQIACNTIVRDGMVVYTNNARVEKARQSVMEFLLINHPIDCPVCDQAGECKLQEYYMKYDQSPSRFDEEKVHKAKVVDLGPLVSLDQERCILCTRCVRFCDEIAGANELCVANRGDHSVLTTFPGRKLENKYSANVVEVCPVGALTNKDFRFKCRVWFLKSTDSICPGCSMGCNIQIDHKEGQVYRLRPRLNEEVNQSWMCDEGRPTYKATHQENRLRYAKHGAEVIRAAEAANLLRELLKKTEPHLICGIGSAEFTNEDNKALMDCLKAAGGTHFLYHKNEPAHPSSDSFLIKADKNPNTKGVESLGFEALSPAHQKRRFKTFVVLGDLSEDTIRALALDDDITVVLFDSWESDAQDFVTLLLPVGTFVETNGSFTNCQGRTQAINQAFPPPGEARSVVEWMKL